MQAIARHLHLRIRLKPQQETQRAQKATKAIILAERRERNKENVVNEHPLALEAELQRGVELDTRYD